MYSATSVILRRPVAFMASGLESRVRGKKHEHARENGAKGLASGACFRGLRGGLETLVGAHTSRADAPAGDRAPPGQRRACAFAGRFIPRCVPLALGSCSEEPIPASACVHGAPPHRQHLRSGANSCRGVYLDRCLPNRAKCCHLKLSLLHCTLPADRGHVFRVRRFRCSDGALGRQLFRRCAGANQMFSSESTALVFSCLGLALDGTPDVDALKRESCQRHHLSAQNRNPPEDTPRCTQGVHRTTLPANRKLTFFPCSIFF